MGNDAWLAVLGSAAILYGIYCGVKDGVKSVITQPAPEDDPRLAARSQTRRSAREVEVPEGKVMVRLGNREWLVDESLTKAPIARKRKRPRKRKAKLA